MPRSTACPHATPSDRAALILTRRAASLRRHPGQWALPGGRVDAGEIGRSGRAARARRGGRARSSMPSARARPARRLHTRSGFVITPVVVWAGAGRRSSPNPAEVASVHRIPVDEFLRADAPMLERAAASTRTRCCGCRSATPGSRRRRRPCSTSSASSACSAARRASRISSSRCSPGAEAPGRAVPRVPMVRSGLAAVHPFGKSCRLVGTSRARVRGRGPQVHVRRGALQSKGRCTPGTADAARSRSAGSFRLCSIRFGDPLHALQDVPSCRRGPRNRRRCCARQPHPRRPRRFPGHRTRRGGHHPDDPEPRQFEQRDRPGRLQQRVRRHHGRHQDRCLADADTIVRRPNGQLRVQPARRLQCARTRATLPTAASRCRICS